MPTMRHCNQCGEDEPETYFREGVCLECWASNQRALDRHNAGFDRWESLTDDQRRTEIDAATRSGSTG